MVFTEWMLNVGLDGTGVQTSPVVEHLLCSKAEINIKFDHELEVNTNDPKSSSDKVNVQRRTIQPPSITDRLLSNPPNVALTSETNGRLHFEPELLGLSDGQSNSNGSKKGHSLILDSSESLPVFEDGESVKGSIYIKLPSKNSGSISHFGIKCDFLGVLHFPGGLRTAITFCSLSTILAAEGRIEGAGKIACFPFEFKHLEMPYESYNGRHIQIKYLIRVTMRRTLGDICAERAVWIQDFTPPPPESTSPGWQLEVGVEDQLHINFSVPRDQFALDDFIVGKLEFNLVTFQIKSADISLVRRELVGTQITDQQVLQRYQIIDGPPTRHDCIPFRLPLANLRDLTPSLLEIEKAAALRYFLNLIIYDSEGRRFFKQQEIQLYRRRRGAGEAPIEITPKSLHLV